MMTIHPLRQVLPQMILKTLFAAVVAVCFSFTCAYAQVEPVQDSLHLLKPEEVSALKKHLVKFEKHFAVIIKYSDDIEQDALNFGRGPNGVDLVIWYSPKHADQPGKIRIETGTRLEGQIPDMLSDQIVKDNLQLLKDRKYYDFFVKITDQLQAKLDAKAVSDKEEAPLGFYIFLIVTAIILWVLLFLVCPDCAMFLLYMIMLGGGKSGSSGDFSGGGSTTED